MVDYHNHILPGIDDGCPDEKTSAEVFGILEGQGITTVVATPHVYAYDESVERFSARRRAAFDKIAGIIPPGMNVVLGAEVAFENGMSDIPDLEKLRIGDSNRILIELPKRMFGAEFGEEVINVCYSKKLKPVFAHIERYPCCLDFEIMSAFAEIDGAVFQITSDAVDSFKTKKLMKKYCEWGMDFIVASDSHSPSLRTARFDKAVPILRKMFGEEKTNEILCLPEKLLLDK